jgi:hypothetical protein
MGDPFTIHSGPTASSNIEGQVGTRSMLTSARNTDTTGHARSLSSTPCSLGPLLGCAPSPEASSSVDLLRANRLLSGLSRYSASTVLSRHSTDWFLGIYAHAPGSSHPAPRATPSRTRNHRSKLIVVAARIEKRKMKRATAEQLVGV